MSLQLLPTKDTKKVYYGGEVVKGSIRLTTKQPLITRSFVILLTAFEKTEVDEYSVSVHPDKIASGSLATAFTPKKKSYKSTRIILNLQYIFLGASWGKRNDAAKTQLNAGDHDFTYSFRLPQLLPATIHHQVNLANEYQITYRLTAHLDSPSVLSFNRSTSKDLIVRGYHISPLALSSALSPKPVAHHASKEFTFESGRLMVRVTVTQRAHFINDDVEFKVEVTNNSKKIVEAISISICQDVNISAMGHTKSDNTALLLAKKLALLVPHSNPSPVIATFHVKIPAHKALFSEVVATHININHFWQFEFHVTSLLAMNLLLKVPFMLFHPDVRPTSLRGTAPPAVPAQVTAKTAPAKVNAKTSPAQAPKSSLQISVPTKAKVTKMRFEFENGDVYDGEWLGGKQHGTGVLLYASGDAFTGVWTHGYKVDGQYSFADPNAEYTSDNVILIPQALTAKNAPTEYSDDVKQEINKLLELPFPLNLSAEPASTCTFQEFVQLGVRLDDPSTQKEAILKFLPLRAHLTNCISGMLASPVNAVQVAIFGTAVHDHYGVFFLLWQYFNPHLVKKWAKHCLTHLTSTHNSTMVVLLAAAQAEIGENAEMLAHIQTLLALPASQTRSETRAVAWYLMATIYNGRLDFSLGDKMCAQGLEACASDAYLLRAQLVVLALRGLRSSEVSSTRKGVKQLSTVVQRELYLNKLRDMYNGRGLFGNVAVALTMNDAGDCSTMMVSCLGAMWQMGFLDGILAIVASCFSHCEPLISHCISISSDLTRPYVNAAFNVIMLQYMIANRASFDQTKPVFDWILHYFEFAHYDGAVRSILIYFSLFRACTEAGRPLEAVQALEAGLSLFFSISADKQHQIESSNGGQLNGTDIDDTKYNTINNNNSEQNNNNNNKQNDEKCNNTGDNKNEVDDQIERFNIATEEDSSDNETDITYEENNGLHDEEKYGKESNNGVNDNNQNNAGANGKTYERDRMMDETAVRVAVETMPSASCLYFVGAMCQLLVSAAPGVPRTSRIVQDLLACATRWAALGHEHAVLFTATLMHSRARIYVALGETRNAIVWWKNVLEVVEEHKKKVLESTAAHKDGEQQARQSEQEAFEDMDFAHGMLNHEAEALSNLGIYHDFPLAQHSESLKWFQRLLTTVDHHLGDTKAPLEGQKLSRKEALLWDKKAVALRGIASSTGHQSTSYEELVQAKQHAESALQLGKVLKFTEARVTTQQNTLARVTKQLQNIPPSPPPSSPPSPLPAPASPAATTSTSPKPAATSTTSPPTSPVFPGTVQWVDATNITQCMRCDTEFGFFTRKHHCRACGCVACAACSPLFLLPQYGSAPQRTCTPCKK